MNQNTQTRFVPVIFAALVPYTLCVAQAHGERTEARVGADIEFFASDQVEGRGVETKGIELAAARIVEEYKKYQLKPGMPDGSYRQPFNVRLGGTVVNDETRVVLSHDGTGTRALTLTSQFQPQQRGGSGSCTGELIFIGYGIQSEEDNYDEYANIDVEGKILVMIRREPAQGQVDGPFRGTKTSPNAYIDRKVQLAKEHKAAGVIFVNDPFTATSADRDELSKPAGFGSTEADLPFVHVKQTVVNDILKVSPLNVVDSGAGLQLSSLQQVCDYIDRTLTPVSLPLTGWTADVNISFTTNGVTAYNIVGVLEGEGPLANETIVVGGHYDHLGYGGYGSRAKNRTGEIHNGADDNASGTAATLEMMRRLATGPPPKRRIVFVCFSGEERGLLGSYHYVNQPVIPLEDTVAMLNFDMVGTLRNNRVEVYGVGTAPEFRSLLSVAADAAAVTTKISTSPFAGSDHLPFVRKNVPVLFFFTGTTPRYHTPDDDFEAINVPGVVKVVDLSETVLRSLIELPNRPVFTPVGNSRQKIPFLGVMPNLGADGDEQGIPLQGIRPNSPAATAGFKVGDAIVKADADDIDSYADLLAFLRKSAAGRRVDFQVIRSGAVVTLTTILGSPR